MAKKKASKSFPIGTRIQIAAGIAIPEFEEVSCEGWTGTIIDTLGKKSDPKYVIEWDDAIMEQLPAEYITQCEAQQLYYRCACFMKGEIAEIAQED